MHYKKALKLQAQEAPPCYMQKPNQLLVLFFKQRKSQTCNLHQPRQQKYNPYKVIRFLSNKVKKLPIYNSKYGLKQ